MDDVIIISNLNDFIFCPASIYFHKLYGSEDNLMYQSSYQINGSKAHEAVDNNSYSTRKNIITSLEVYSDKYSFLMIIWNILRLWELRAMRQGYIFREYLIM